MQQIKTDLICCIEKIYSRGIAIVTILPLYFFHKRISDVEVICDAGESGCALQPVISTSFHGRKFEQFQPPLHKYLKNIDFLFLYDKIQLN